MDIQVFGWDTESGHRNEDGNMICFMTFLIWATAYDGSRWELNHRFAGSVEWVGGGEDTDGEMWQVARHGDEAAANRLAEKIRDHIARGGALNVGEHWREIDPAYGSAAYEVLDRTGYFYQRERNEEMGAY